MFDQIVAVLPTVLGGAFLTIMGLLLTAGVASGITLIRSKIGSQYLDILAQVADTAVKAAEQSPDVQNKKQSALNAAAATLTSLGIKVSPEALDAAIESAVLQAFNYNYDTGAVKPSSAPAVDAPTP